MGVMLMSDKERRRKAVFEMVKQGKITLKQASKQCGLSYRQTLRVYQSYLAKGDAGLIHQSRGQRSNRRHPHQEEIINLYQSKYEGFGPTLASEYLFEDGYSVNHETLRQWLISNQLWEKKRKRSPYRKRREPKAQFGELVQIDGSIHDWFESGKHDCLLNMVDDATGTTLAVLDSGETTKVVFTALMKWMKKYGIPQAIYVDLKTVYISPSDDGFSHVQRACDKLGIRIIKARSPQAKGRVERNHAVYQDRFVKALRLKQIKEISKANQFLEKTFIDSLNEKFAKKPRKPESAHADLMNVNLDEYLCWEYERKLNNDWTVSFQGETYQVDRKFGKLIKPKNKVQVKVHLNDSISMWFNGIKLSIKKAVKTEKLSNLRSKIKQTKRKQKAANSSHWHYSNAFLFGEADKTQEKLARLNREFNLKPPPNRK